MHDDEDLCGRCGAPLGQGTVHIFITAADESESDVIPSVDACQECAKSLSRWLDRKRGRIQDGPKPRASRGRKRSKKRGFFPPKREHIALVLVIILSLFFCYYVYQNFLEVPE